MKSSLKKYISSTIISSLIFLNFSVVIHADKFNELKTSETEIYKSNNSNAENKYSNVYKKFSKKLGIDKNKLTKLLSLKEGKNNFKLIPISNSKEFTEFWKDLFVRANPNYMKYYASGKLKTNSQATADFKRRYNRMWNPNSKKNIKPFSMAFITTFNGEFAGEIVVGPIRGSKNIVPEIGYVILQKFSGKHIASKALKILIDFLKNLNNSNICNIKTLRATAHLKNYASQKVLSKCGFTAQKKLIYSFGGRPTKDYRLSIK